MERVQKEQMSNPHNFDEVIYSPEQAWQIADRQLAGQPLETTASQEPVWRTLLNGPLSQTYGGRKLVSRAKGPGAQYHAGQSQQFAEVEKRKPARSGASVINKQSTLSSQIASGSTQVQKRALPSTPKYETPQGKGRQLSQPFGKPFGQPFSQPSIARGAPEFGSTGNVFGTPPQGEVNLELQRLVEGQGFGGFFQPTQGVSQQDFVQGGIGEVYSSKTASTRHSSDAEYRGYGQNDGWGSNYGGYGKSRTQSGGLGGQAYGQRQTGYGMTRRQSANMGYQRMGQSGWNSDYNNQGYTAGRSQSIGANNWSTGYGDSRRGSGLNNQGWSGSAYSPSGRQSGQGYGSGYAQSRRQSGQGYGSGYAQPRMQFGSNIY